MAIIFEPRGNNVDSRYGYNRRHRREVMVGNVGVGGNNPIRVQSMTIASTLDTEKTVTEAIGLAEAGCEIVRITAQGPREAANLEHISKELNARGCFVPLVADIHFSPRAAMIAADFVDKVRINPGNFADTKKFATRDYSDSEYQEEIERIHETFRPLILKLKNLGKSLRIGTNHGSLSDRIMNHFGDTAEGMVESAIEFIKIAEIYDYKDIIVSMKASNPAVMVQAYRMLVERFRLENMDYPLHLGVTEAGDGEDGRVKSAAGIGALLEDGIGDTVRVSLTEDAIYEIPAAKRIVERYQKLPPFQPIGSIIEDREPDIYNIQHKKPTPVRGFNHFPLFFKVVENAAGNNSLDQTRDYLSKLRTGSARTHDTDSIDGIIIESATLQSGLISTEKTLPIFIELNPGIPDGKPQIDSSATYSFSFRINSNTSKESVKLLLERLPANNPLPVLFHFSEAMLMNPDDITAWLDFIDSNTSCSLVSVQSVNLQANSDAQGYGENTGSLDEEINGSLQEAVQSIGQLPGITKNYRLLDKIIKTADSKTQILLRARFKDYESLLYDASTHFGSLLIDGIGNAVLLEVEEMKHPESSIENLESYGLNLLQATRKRISRTEFISCPSCGRTLFDLQSTTARIKEKTSHLKGVKIAIMGCIVNGPGEMADADFGYVGAGIGKISLYRGHEVVKKNIPADQADEKLIELIKEYGMWQDP